MSLNNGKNYKKSWLELDNELRNLTDLPGLDDPLLFVQYLTGLQDSLNLAKQELARLNNSNNIFNEMAGKNQPESIRRPLIDSNIETSPSVSTANSSSPIIIVNALKEKIIQLESQLASTNKLVKTQSDEAALNLEELLEEQTIRKGLQERLRVILEELEELRSSNVELQSQLRELTNNLSAKIDTKSPTLNSPDDLVNTIAAIEKKYKIKEAESNAEATIMKDTILDLTDKNRQLQKQVDELSSQRNEYNEERTQTIHLKLILKRLFQNPCEQVN